MSAVDTTFEQPKPLVATVPGPVATKNRIVMLDVLRGFAVLGILAVNALAFAWPFDVMMSPEAAPYLNDGVSAAGDATATWIVDVFFADKMRTLFEMLFGVSIFLVGGERSNVARGSLLRRRLFWLAVIGLLHGLVLWYGDILLLYGLCGFIMMLMRSWSAGRLLWIGGGVTLAFALIAAGGAMFMANAPADLAAQMNDNPFAATPQELAATIAAYNSGLSGSFVENAKAWAMAAGFGLPVFPFVTVPLMMLGLGLFKSGFWLGRSPTWIYGLLIGLAGLNLVGLGLGLSQELAAPVPENPSGGLAGAMAAFAPLVTLGYASALILMTTKGLGVVTRVLAPVGRMAFTNYLTQTLIMTSLFYMPWGPRWMGEVTPAGLWPIVIAIWVLQLIWSPLWLSRFEMGPLEWVWRCLTYGRRVPIRKAATA